MGAKAELTGDSYRGWMRRSTGSGKRDALASCNDYVVEARDGPAGTVETPLFPPDGSEADYLVLRVGARRRVVSTALVKDVDPGRRLVRLRVTTAELERIPEDLPLANPGVSKSLRGAQTTLGRPGAILAARPYRSRP
jgi:hypothetical protein